MNGSEIQKRFVEYYEGLGYQLLPRASLLDPSIPMSFVMSAGLVQVEQSLAKTQVRDKDKFVLVQDCFRHFDLEKVGTDDIHLSIFKMPGAFKFGSNGKVETVERMWHLATSVLNIQKDKLWVSYFGGGDVEGTEFAEDEVTHRAWVDVGMPTDRIIGLGFRDNFWLQGTGFDGEDRARKSGPNTELFFDRGSDKTCGIACRPGCKCGRFIEFSNSLFIRFELQAETGEFHPLADPFSETVIGAERVAMILQDKDSVFEIDSYETVLQLIRTFYNQEDTNLKLAHIGERIIIDHLRALVYLIADNAPPPGKNGRQRLIKKLIRGILAGMMTLDITHPEFLSQVLDCLLNTIEDSYIERKLVKDRFRLFFSMQLESFFSTVLRGKRELEEIIHANGYRTLSGNDIVRLEKEWGLPYVLTAKELSLKCIPFPESEYRQSLTNWKNFSDL